jgi:hypothetical protein
MGKKYEKPAIIGSTKIDPKPDSCQQGEASAPESTRRGQPQGRGKGPGGASARGHLKIVRKNPAGR